MNRVSKKAAHEPPFLLGEIPWGSGDLVFWRSFSRSDGWVGRVKAESHRKGPCPRCCFRIGAKGRDPLCRGGESRQRDCRVMAGNMIPRGKTLAGDVDGFFGANGFGKNRGRLHVFLP